MVSWYYSLGEPVLTGNFHYEQAKDLLKHCRIAIYYPYDRTITENYHCETENGLLTYRSKYKLEKKIRNRSNMFQTMYHIKKEFQPDLIHAHVATEAGRFAIMLGKLFSIPVMITEHSAVEASGVMTFPHYYYAKFAYKRSKYNVCVSDELAKRLHMIFPKITFHVIYNGIIKPVVKKSSVYCKKSTVNVVMVAGMYDWNIKGIPTFMKVIRRLIGEGQSLTIHFVGGGEYFEQFIALSKELNIYENCVFYGNCDKNKVYDIVADMDFLVSASLFESFGCSMAEALMLGKPILATKSGGAQSIVNEKNGLLIEKDNEEALYNGMLYMMQNYQNYSAEQLADNAEENFEINRISKKYLDIYMQIIH